MKESRKSKDEESRELMRYQELLTDFHQGNQQSGLELAGEVDVERFTKEEKESQGLCGSTLHMNSLEVIFAL